MESILKNGKKLKIREAVPTDASELLKYLNAVGGETDYLTFGKDGAGLSLKQEIAFIESKRKNKAQLFVVGIVDETIVAALGIVPGKRKRVSHCGEFGMTVKKNYWSVGIGSLLIDYLLDWAKRRGVIKKINLSVRTDNLRAINLYLKKGFLIEGRNRRGMQIDGESFDFYYMGKILD